MKQKIPYFIALLPIITTVTLLITTVFYFKIPLFIPLLIGYIFTLLIAVIYNVNLKEMWLASIKGIKSISAVFIILILVGVLIAIWSSSGTIDALVYYGLGVINPKYLIVTSFFSSLLVSMLLGTSVGTASTVGVAFMGMAHSLGFNPSLVAGALVSGAFVGDRTSPLSSAAHINSVVTETKYYNNIKELMKTLIPVVLITTVIYLILGNTNNSLDIDYNELVNQSREQLLELYGTLSLWLLLPPLFILIVAFFKVTIRNNLLIGSLIGAVLAYIYQEKTIFELVEYAVFGFHHPNGYVFGGGWNMFYQILLIIISGAFYGLLESSGILSIVLQKIVSGFTDKLSIARKTMSISIYSALLSSTQTISILIPGKVMLKYYKEFNIDPKLLNRFISDSGMVVSGLIPWNLNAILLGIALNISVIDYLPYSFLLIILPIYSYYQYRWDFRRKEKSSRRNLANFIEL